MKKFLLENKNNNINISINEISLINKEKIFYLYENKKQWMAYTTFNEEEENQFLSSFEIANGHCVLSGLGFGILPEMLLKKSNVLSITIFEKSKDIIELNKKYNINFESYKIINQPIENICQNQKCDCLLLDHYEHETDDFILENVKQISGLIKTDILWFWRFESIFYNFYIKNNFEDFEIAFDFFKKTYNIPLPNLKKDKLFFYIKNFKQNFQFHGDFPLK